MDYVQFFTLMTTLLGGFCILYREMRSEIKNIREEIKVQSQRSDQLYTMFIDLLKSKKDV